MTWKEFNTLPMGRILNAGIAISALAGVYVAFSTEAVLNKYVMMGAILVTFACGIVCIGLAANEARRQALILILALPCLAQVFFAWCRITHTTTDTSVGVVMVIAAALFSFLALFPPKVTTDADQTPPPAAESSH